MTTIVNFVCDRTPDENGCRFIECENAHGESINAGEWRLRADGLVELHVEFSQPALITALHENGDLIAAQATIAQQAKMIEHLRGGPTPLYTAVDMANAAADGFRDGVASVVVDLPSPSQYDGQQAVLIINDCREAIIDAGGSLKQ